MASVAILFKGQDESEATAWQPLVGSYWKRHRKRSRSERNCPAPLSVSWAVRSRQRWSTAKLLSALPGMARPVSQSLCRSEMLRCGTIDAERRNEQQEARARNNR